MEQHDEEKTNEDETNEDETDEDETYEFKTNVNKPLAKILNIQEFIPDNDNKNPVWKPPEEHGLNNSQYIIPNYYHNSRTNSITMDYAMIKDDIRNMRSLNENKLEYIKNLCHDKKNELFDIFNDCIVTINDVLNTI
jgi:hypothetical protein